MGRHRNPAPAAIETEVETEDMENLEVEEGDEAEEEEEEGNETDFDTSKKISKATACRAALAAGITKYDKALQFVQSRYRMDIKPSDFALYKTKEKYRLGAPKGKRGRKPKNSTPPLEGDFLPSTKSKVAGEPDVLMALEGVKELVSQFGADRVKRMVDLLG